MNQSRTIAVTGAGIWESYLGASDTHANIPDCSYAGYQCGEQPIPDVPVVADVRDYGARGDDGEFDSTAAIQAAVDAAGEQGGGAVLVPSGRYCLEGMLFIGSDGVVLRGEGMGETILSFKRPLCECCAPGYVGKGPTRVWSWSGGLIWVSSISPAQRADMSSVASGTMPNTRWLGADERCAVKGIAERGDDSIRLSGEAASGIRPGSLLLLEWHNSVDDSLLHTIAGHPLMREYPWRDETEHHCYGGQKYAVPGIDRFTWQWTVEVAEVTEDVVKLRQPLRVCIRPEWRVTVRDAGPYITGSGVENLSMEMPPHERTIHGAEVGYNGIYYHRCLHCWAKNVRVVNSDNGIGLTACKNVTLQGFQVLGQDLHHGTTTRVFSHDNLLTDFVMDARPMHGVNVEGYSSGNVWQRGQMKHGTFDSHRAMAFDCLYTDITLANDGTPGGGLNAGPFYGARCVRWNVRIASPDGDTVLQPWVGPNGEIVNDKHRLPSGVWVYQPDLISEGALVGIQGAPVCADRSDSEFYMRCKGLLMPPGDKNCLVADHGRVPNPANLYEAQLKYRLGAEGSR